VSWGSSPKGKSWGNVKHQRHRWNWFSKGGAPTDWWEGPPVGPKRGQGEKGQWAEDLSRGPKSSAGYRPVKPRGGGRPTGGPLGVGPKKAGLSLKAHGGRRGARPPFLWGPPQKKIGAEKRGNPPSAAKNRRVFWGEQTEATT